MKTGLTHIALDVAETARSIAFYEDWCGMEVVHKRPMESRPGEHITWMASPDYRDNFVIVLIPGRQQPHDIRDGEFGHLGFALESKQAVQEKHDRAKAEDLLYWPLRQDPWPVGTYFGIRDPDGHAVEFSHGQPIGQADMAKHLSRA